MNEDFEDRLRLAIRHDEVEILADTRAAIREGRRVVRGQRVGWGVAACAVVAAAALLLPGVVQRGVPAVPAPAATSGATHSAAPDPGVRLAGTAWFAERLRGAPLADGTRITLEFGDHRVSGYDGCNWFSQDGGEGYRQDGGSLTIRAVGSTLRLCTGAGINEQELAFTAALREVARFRVDGGRLILLDPAGETLVEFRSFTADGRTWTLDPLTGKWVGEHSGITLLINGTSVSGSTPCGSYTAQLSREGTRWTFTRIRKAPQSCPYQAGHPASVFLDRLARVTVGRAYADGPRLVLKLPDDELVFSTP